MADGAAPRIVIDGVQLAFRGPDGSTVAVLGGVTLEIGPSEFVCLLGPSGCGKTTLLNCVAGFLAPSAGKILIDGAPIAGTPPEVGIVFQEHALFPWFTVQHNVEYGLRVRGVARAERERVARELIDLVGLAGFERHYPHQLSGGMKQRVGIARTLVNDPSVLLMDEPFGALDAMTREAMQEELLRVWERDRKTVVFVTHSIAEAVFLADRVVVLSPRPGTVRAQVPVTARRLRSRTSDAFIAAYREVEDALRREETGTLTSRRALNAVSIASLLVGWYAVTAAGWIHPFLLPSPGEVVGEAWDLTRSGVIFRFAGVSLLRVVGGFLIGAAVALPLGMLIGRLRVVRDLCDPILELARPVPALALIPLAIAWFGIGELSKVFLISYAAFFPVVINVIAGFHAVDPTHVRAARSLRASEVQVFRDVVLMSAFPYVVAGLRLGMGMAFLVLVAAELIASNAGLGYLIQEARLNFNTPRIFVGIIAIGLLGYALSKTLLELERRVVPWKYV